MKHSEALIFKAFKPISFDTILWFVGFIIKASWKTGTFGNSQENQLYYQLPFPFLIEHRE